MSKEMQLSLQREKEIVEYVAKKNAIIEPSAVSLLKTEQEYRKILDGLLEQGFIVTEKAVSEKLLKKETKIGNVEEVVVGKTRFRAAASEIEGNFRVMEEYDVTNHSYSEGKVKDFMEMFKDKFEYLSAILKARNGFNAKPISRIARIPNNNEIEIIGMLFKKWESKNGHLVMQFEDEEASCLVLVHKNDKKLNEEAAKVMLDNVIGIKGRKIGGEMVVAKEILWPDMPQKPAKKISKDVSILCISDIHVGSKLFMEKEFSNFLNWIHGNSSVGNDLERIGKIKYLFITGDNVDGVGVYPDQYDELSIKDLNEQYDGLSELINQIPEYIEIFMCPGQHDAVRRADPQPSIPKKYFRGLSSHKNFHPIGSPSWVEIEGLKCMVYHGASLHDLYSSVNYLSASKPQEAMAELLKRRDLMVSYGMKQPYVPEKKDFMLIREEPDFYFGGDMHHNGYMQYRGCTIINSGTWQDRTDFQIQQGHVPTPGIAVEVDLKTRNLRETHFAAKA